MPRIPDRSMWHQPSILAMLIENTNDIITVIDGEGVLLYESPSFSRLLGYGVVELIGEPATAYVHPDDVPAVTTAIGEAMADLTSVHSVTFRFRHRDGSWRVLEGRGRRITGPDGIPALLVNSRDVTDRHQAEMRNRAQQQFLGSIYHESQLPIFVVDVSEEGEFRFAGLNPAHERLTGLSSLDLEGKTPEELVPMIPKAAAEAVRDNYERCRSAGIAITYEEMIPILGKETWWLTRLSPLRDAEGRVYRIVGGAYPITERKQLEADLQSARDDLERRVVERTAELDQTNIRLRQNEAALRSLVNAITEYAFLMTPEGRLVVVNETTAERMGHPIAALQGQNVFEYLPRDLATSRLSQLRRVVETGKPVRFEDLQSGRRIDNTVYPVLDSRGQVRQVAVIGRDITDQLEAESQLLLKHHAMEASISAIALADMTGHLTYANPAFVALWGYDEPEDVMGRHVLEFWSDQASANRVLQEMREHGAWSGRERARRRDGTYVELQCTTNLVEGTDGSPVAIMASFVDVSPLVEAEAALRESEDRYRTLAEASPDMIFTIDRDDTVQYVNSHAARQFGVEPDAVVGKPRRSLFAPEIAEGQGHALARVFETGEMLFSESIADFPGGEVWLHTELVPIRDERGVTTHVMGVSRDITTRKQAEAHLISALEELEQRNAELTQFNSLAVGREKRMIELKQEVNQLAEMLGRRPPYDLDFLS